MKLFRGEYVYAYDLLKILAFSSLVAAPNVLYINLERVRRRVSKIILVNGIIAFVTIIGSVLFVKSLGLITIGYAYALANLFAFIVAGTTKLLKI